MQTTATLIAELQGIAEPAEVDKVRRFFKGGDPETEVMGVPIGKVFPVARRFATLGLDHVETLLDDRRYEVPHGRRGDSRRPWTREAGKRDEKALIRFLTANRDRLPKPTMTAASKRLPPPVRERLRSRR
ncbi:MAG: hypothetical protein OXF93_19365 [Acidobacteria bacterium]|nr:hypothetical protein [Acidobacteriota bacterium]